jgi:hypothetical protein
MRLAFICDFCAVNSTSISETKKHEKHCLNNPQNKHCYTCRYHLSIGNGAYDRCISDQDNNIDLGENYIKNSGCPSYIRSEKK